MKSNPLTSWPKRTLVCRRSVSIACKSHVVCHLPWSVLILSSCQKRPKWPSAGTCSQPSGRSADSTAVVFIGERAHAGCSVLRWRILLPVTVLVIPSVLLRCWLGDREGIRPVKNWVVGCWRGYLPGARCRLAYRPADATATHCLLLQ